MVVYSFSYPSLLCVATQMKKFYKTLFLGLVDMAVVNAFIVTKCAYVKRDEKPVSHADFLLQLQAQLLALRDDDFKARALPDRRRIRAFHPEDGSLVGANARLGQERSQAAHARVQGMLNLVAKATSQARNVLLLH